MQTDYSDYKRDIEDEWDILKNLGWAFWPEMKWKTSSDATVVEDRSFYKARFEELPIRRAVALIFIHFVIYQPNASRCSDFLPFRKSRRNEGWRYDRKLSRPRIDRVNDRSKSCWVQGFSWKNWLSNWLRKLQFVKCVKYNYAQYIGQKD